MSALFLTSYFFFRYRPLFKQQTNPAYTEFMKWILAILFFGVTSAFAQPATDTSNVKYKARIKSIVDGQQETLQSNLQTDAVLYQDIFGPCTGSGKGGIKASQNNFINELRTRVQSVVDKIYSSESAPVKNFGKRGKSEVEGDFTAEIKKRSKKLIAYVNGICEDSKPPVQANSPPTVNIRNLKPITWPTNSAKLIGDVVDPDGDNLDYQWSKQGNPPGDIIAEDKQSSTPVTFATPGKYQYVLSVNDGHDHFVSDTVIVIVKAQPLVPIVNAGEDRVIRWPENTVKMKGSGSNPDGSHVDFNWIRTSVQETDNIISPADPLTNIEFTQPGNYSYRLTVTNGAGLKVSDDVNVSVLPPIENTNLPPNAFAGFDTTIQWPDHSVTLHGTASDPENEPIRILWKKVSDTPGGTILSSRTPETKVDNLEEGQYIFEISVTDNQGQVATDRVIVNVRPPTAIKNNIPPTVDAGPDQKIKLTSGVAILTATGKDEDGTIVSYEWTFISGKGNPEIISPTDSSTRVDKLTEGNYTFQVKVTDNDRMIGTDTVILKVSGPDKKSLIWLWVLIGSLITIAAAGGSYYFFIWYWRKKKVLVYFLSKGEEEIVHSIMPESKTTDGYAVGHCTRAKIKEMRKKRIPVRILNTTELTVHTPGVSRTYKYSYKKGALQLKSVTSAETAGAYTNLVATASGIDLNEVQLPAFYIITLDTPLLPIYKDSLASIGLKVIQRIPDNSYVVLVQHEEQLAKLHEMTYIRVLSPYTPADTGFLVHNKHNNRDVVTGSDVKWILDVVLHRKEDTESVFTFLQQNEIEITDSGEGIFRIRIRPDQSIARLLASNKYIQSVYEYTPPELYNDRARVLVGIDSAAPDTGYITERGEGEIIAVADTGIDEEHADLKNQILHTKSWGRKENNDTSDPHGHGTHVTGTIVGDGTASDGMIKGMAPAAKVFFQSLLDDNGLLCDLKLQLPALLQEAYDQGARIMNISWGSNTDSLYTFDSVAMDRFAFENPEMLFVVSAGNQAAGKRDEQGNLLPGFGTIGSPAVTKNGLTVGASKSNRNDDNPEEIAPFSSKGPCKPERRIKPDIVAPGTSILSAKSGLAPDRNFESFFKNPSYVFLSGTSMATPVVAGAAALVREYYRTKQDYGKPSAALIKATILNGGKQLNAASAMLRSKMIPNNNQGFGMLDMTMTIPNQLNEFKLEYYDAFSNPGQLFMQTGEKRFFRIVINKPTWLRICMVFIDNPATGGQNDLDLIVRKEGDDPVWNGNSGINATMGEELQEDQHDFVNTNEIIRMKDAEPGNYLIAVEATNVAQEGRIGFALVVTTGDLSATFSKTEL